MAAVHFQAPIKVQEGVEWGGKPGSPKDGDEWRKKQKDDFSIAKSASHNPKPQQWYHTLGQEMGQDSEAFLASAMPTPEPQLSPSRARAWSCVKNFSMRNIFSQILKGK